VAASTPAAELRTGSNDARRGATRILPDLTGVSDVDAADSGETRPCVQDDGRLRRVLRNTHSTGRVHEFLQQVGLLDVLIGDARSTEATFTATFTIDPHRIFVNHYQHQMNVRAWTAGARKGRGLLMLTITVQADNGIVRLRLEGRLAGLHVPEVERSWRRARFNQPRRRIVVDLAAVSFVDVLGKELLRQVHRHGDTLLPGGVMTEAVIDEITREDVVF